MRSVIRLAVAMIALAGAARPAAAQQVETPVAFDSAGSIRAMTPGLVERFGLVPPVWPVTGDFVEARLHAVSTGGHVLVVQRRTGAIERYPLSDAAAADIAGVVNASLARSAAPTSLAPVASAPAGGTFARNQMILTWILYGPLLASIADDGRTGTALYLLATGASFFITQNVAKKSSVTRAQNHLATDGALRGWGAAAGLLYASNADVGQKMYSTVGLAGAIGGAVAGVKYGKGLTDAEAQSATAISNFAALAAMGLSVTTGLTGDTDDGRAAVGSAVAAGLAGYVMGPSYPRRATYTVTRGDVQLLTIGAALGIMTFVTPIVESDVDEQTGFGLATAGMLTGLLVAERTFVRKYDHTSSEASQIWLGTIAGSLMGSAMAVLLDVGGAGAMGLATGGAIVGTIAGHSLAAPRRAGEQARISLPGRLGGVEVNPAAAVMAGMGARGTHSLLTIRF